MVTRPRPSVRRATTAAIEPAALPRWAIAVVALLAVLNLLGALGGALVRVGTLAPAAAGPTGTAAVLAHGALMMAGFFGTLIALERAVALHRGLWVPLLAGVGGLCAWIGGAGPWSTAAQALWLASALGLVGLYAWAGRHRAWSLPLAVEGSGALALLVGTLAAAFGQAELARLGWSAFLVLTIAGERRELMRLVRLPAWSARAFLWGWALLALAIAGHALGAHAAALALWWCVMAALALWLLRFDIAPRQWRAAGWAGHTAICLSIGYGWLLLAAVLGLAGQPVAWHVLWLGFVMAMVFGHAPIMLPALAGWRPRPTRWALLPLGLMGASVALRVAVTLADLPQAWPLVGAAHVVALLSFALLMAHAVWRGESTQGRVGSRP